MGCKKKYLFLPAVLVCCLVAHVAAVPLTDLFPFGLKFGDDSLPPGDDTSATVTLQQHFPFYGKSRHSITVNITCLSCIDHAGNFFSKMKLPKIDG